jgi:hypothetical protein
MSNEDNHPSTSEHTSLDFFAGIVRRNFSRHCSTIANSKWAVFLWFPMYVMDIWGDSTDSQTSMAGPTKHQKAEDRRVIFPRPSRSTSPQVSVALRAHGCYDEIEDLSPLTFDEHKGYG